MKRTSLVAVVAIALLATAGVAVAANSVINHDAAATPDEKISFELTKDTHNLTWDGPAVYEGNNGDLTTLNASVNETYDNPHSFIASDVEFADAGAFPHNKPDVSALEAAEWSKDGGSSTGTLTVADTETAPNVDALSLSTSGQSSGDTAVFSASNFSVDSDAEKRYLQFVADVSTLESGATVQVRAVDSDGDYYRAVIDSSRSTGEDLAANSTGEGVVFQRQLGKMTLNTSNGDGSFDGIQSIKVVALDGDATVTFAALNVEKMSKWSFGEEKYHADDDELETRTIHESMGGEVSVHGLDTLGPAFDNAEVKGLTFDVRLTAEDLPAEDQRVERTETDAYPGYKGTATVYYRLEIPDQYDLAWSGAELEDTQTVTSGRLMSVEVAENAGADVDNLSKVEDSAYTDVTGSYGSRGDEVVVDSTVSVGQSYVLKYKLKLDAGQYDALAMDASTGGAPMQGQQEGGGLAGLGIFGGLVTFLYGIIRKFRGGS